MDFSHKEIDEVGLQTLSVIENADRFNRWMYQTIKPYLKGKVIEIGSGTGNISEHALKDGFEVTLTDIRENYRDILKKKFANNTNLNGVASIDIAHPDFENAYREFIGKFDSLFCLNVIEHIKDDQLAMQNCGKLLKKGGNLIILVPAYQFLYNDMDRQLEHYRRYRIASLTKIFPSNFRIMHKQHFNMAGILGWYVSGRIMNNKSIPGGQMKLYNSLVGIFKLIDRITFSKIGLSVIAVGQKAE